MMNNQDKLLVSSIGLVLIIWGSTVQAATHMITFEEPGISAMENIPVQVYPTQVPAGAQLATMFLPSVGVLFSSGAGYAAVVDHGYPHLTPSAPNVLGGTNALGQLDYTAPITVTFFNPSHTTQKATTDFVQVLGDWAGLGSGSVTMIAYDKTGILLGSVTDIDNYPFGQGPLLTLNMSGIHSAVLSGTSGTVGFDNFEFNIPLVPEPNTWALLLVGLGLLCFVAHRRKIISV